MPILMHGAGAKVPIAEEIGALPLTGGTMSGPLTLAGVPSTENQAATKGYVDNKRLSVRGGEYLYIPVYFSGSKGGGTSTLSPGFFLRFGSLIYGGNIISGACADYPSPYDGSVFCDINPGAFAYTVFVNGSKKYSGTSSFSKSDFENFFSADINFNCALSKGDKFEIVFYKK